MRVLVCPTAFKGTVGAAEAASAMAEGVRRGLPGAEVDLLPLSDGGPGLLEAIRTAEGGRLERVTVEGPLGEPAEGRIFFTGDGGAVIESADACGLEALGGRRAPLEAHTRGVGRLVEVALAAVAADSPRAPGSPRRFGVHGLPAVRIGLGGSASTDGGTGMARAFGFRFLDAAGAELPPGGGGLARLARIAPGRIPEERFVALADVETTLTGARGAARTFGPQKGATAEEVERLVDGLERLAERLAGDLDADVAGLPGSGAAGGLGAGCAAFLGAELVPGSDWVLERVGFLERLGQAELVLTGEGAWDRSSRYGKITGRVLERASAACVPALLLCGRTEGGVPDGTAVLDGGGRVLDARGLAALAEEGASAIRRAD